ncbi:MAG: endonuclease/exonuclease/phosphatase family protein, partial [Bacteroidales bacterium]|nr:endonuclease/exonuclease/phosphatase family protein [Bacteroidales bacterium]
MELRRKRSFGAGLFLLLALAAAGALLAAYLAPYLNPASHPVAMFFGLYYVPIVLLNLFFLLAALLKYRRALLVPVVALLPSLLVADRFVKSGRGEEVPDGRPVRVLTYNLGRYNAGRRKVTVNESVAGIRQFLSEQDADVVCLQEFAVKDTAALAPYLPAYPYRSIHLFKGNRWFGNATLSKYPILHEETLTFPESRNMSLITDIDLQGRTVRVYNCHLESFSISFPVVF